MYATTSLCIASQRVGRLEPCQPHARSRRKARTELRYVRRVRWRWCSGLGSARAALGMPTGSRRSVWLSAKAASVPAARALRLRRHSNPTLTRATSRMGVITAVAQRVSGVSLSGSLTSLSSASLHHATCSLHESACPHPTEP